jgi:hypothetical protein
MGLNVRLLGYHPHTPAHARRVDADVVDCFNDSCERLALAILSRSSDGDRTMPDMGLPAAQNVLIRADVELGSAIHRFRIELRGASDLARKSPTQQQREYNAKSDCQIGGVLMPLG